MINKSVVLYENGLSPIIAHLSKSSKGLIWFDNTLLWIVTSLDSWKRTAMELNGNVYKASVKSTQSDNYTACLCCLHAETNVLSEYTMMTYTRLHCFFHRGDIHKTVIETGHPKQKISSFDIHKTVIETGHPKQKISSFAIIKACQ